MVERVNGFSFAQDNVVGDMDFFTVRTTQALPVTGVSPVNATAQARFELMLETISTRAQPVVLGAVVSANETNPADLLGGTGGAVAVYTVRFAVEHAQAWAAEDLAEAFDGVDTFVYTLPVSGNNVAVTKSNNL